MNAKQWMFIVDKTAKTASNAAIKASKAGSIAVDGACKGVFSPSRTTAAACIVAGIFIATFITFVFGLAGAIVAWAGYGAFIMVVETVKEKSDKKVRDIFDDKRYRR